MDEWVKLHGEEPTNSVMGIIIILDNAFNSSRKNRKLFRNHYFQNEC